MTTKQEIVRRVKGYIHRMKTDSCVKKYDLNEIGTYKIFGGSRGDFIGREIIGIANGRFVDVIAYASNLEGFLGDWCSWHMPENCNHGYLEKVNIQEVKDNVDLESVLNNKNYVHGEYKQ